jgi:hypothetical protein
MGTMEGSAECTRPEGTTAGLARQPDNPDQQVKLVPCERSRWRRTRSTNDWATLADGYGDLFDTSAQLLSRGPLPRCCERRAGRCRYRHRALDKHRMRIGFVDCVEEQVHARSEVHGNARALL